MVSGIYSSLSGLTAAQKRITTAAHNTANANTDGFKKQRVLHQEVKPQGVETVVEQVNTPGPIAFRETENGLIQFEQSNVDFAEEAVNLLVGKRHYEANLRALDVQNKTLGSVLDILE
ncbi:flagellar basal body rod C-terminal domain-containing protein [Candidatus Nitronereus thalassa]|uniref:Flagellar basal body rod C-terminal domain-containing protein n=1 Tax=Candidatus Nitronereus thalassa TaxID=3020898 RepID=A0ABU3K4S5_9BACT|nr:flagellar basal body rod C-terminal domain-containing protein [Candidatus Nitronereus thalassa]MDT7041360.1 flagellar basal body rod C-terminal domain-containing protein [Candidatus Nitronereus thalassa]